MSARWRRFGMAAGWGVVIGWLPMLVMHTIAIQSPDGLDFGMFYAAAEMLRLSPHANIYPQQALIAAVLAQGRCGIPLDGPYPYQPLFALLLEPLTLIPCQEAATVWVLLNFGLWFGVAASYTVQTWRRYGSTRALVVAMMTVFFLPVLSGIHFGQVHLILLVCMLAGIILVERNHQYAGGAALGFGVVFKYFPAFLVFYYLLRGRWRVAGSAAAVSVTLIFIEWLIVGPQTLLGSIGAASSSVRLGAALFQDGNWMRSLFGGVPLAYLAGFAFVAVVIWLQWFQRRTGNRAGHEVLGAGWAIATMLLLSPLVWWSYLTWLLPAIMVCLNLTLQYAREHAAGRDWRALARRWWPVVTLAVVYGLFQIPQYNKGAANYREMAIGTLLLWLLCGALYLWSAGVRLPDGVPSLRAWRRSPVGVAASNGGGAGAVSP